MHACMRVCVCVCVCELALVFDRLAWITSRAQETPAHVDGRGGQAVPLGGGVPAADHQVVGEAHAACRHAAVARMVCHRAADAAHHTPWWEGGREGGREGGWEGGASLASTHIIPRVPSSFALACYMPPRPQSHTYPIIDSLPLSPADWLIPLQPAFLTPVPLSVSEGPSPH